MTARVAATTGAVAFAVAAAGCTHGDGGPTISVAPRLSASDEPVHIAVRGLPPRATATVAVRSTDADGVRWRSSAGFRADGDGAI